jgi:hypothetical protein
MKIINLWQSFILDWYVKFNEIRTLIDFSDDFDMFYHGTTAVREMEEWICMIIKS